MPDDFPAINQAEVLFDFLLVGHYFAERPVPPPGSVTPLTYNWDEPVDIEF
jgi:hypothetical protein